MSTASTPTPTPTSASTTPVSSVRYPFLVGGPPGLGLGLFPNYATRAAAQSAGVYVGAYNEALPVKGWADPSGTGGNYSYFDPTAESTGYVSELFIPPSQAAVYNLPGIAYFPPPVYLPCIVTQGGYSNDLSDVVCNESDAQTMLTTLQNYEPALFPNKTLTLKEDQGGMFPIQYAATETRRKWMILVNGVSIGPAQAYIMDMNKFGVGAPINWVMEFGEPQAVEVTQVQTAPTGAVVLPMPIRALLPGESIQPLPSKPPGAIAWSVVNQAEQLTAAQANYETVKAQYEAAIAELVAAGGTPS